MSESPHSTHIQNTTDGIPGDLQLRNRGATIENVQLALAGRLLAVIATDPEVAFDVPTMAIQSGMTEIEVESIFRQRWFAKLLEEQALGAISRALPQGIDVVSSIMKDPDIRPDVRLRAFSELIKGYKTMVEAAPMQDAESERTLAEGVLEKLRTEREQALRKIRISQPEIEAKAAEVKRASDGSHDPRTVSPSSRDDEGGDRRSGDE